MKFFKKWVEKNRQKTEAEKKGVALFFSFIITSFVFIIWIMTLFINTSGFAPNQSQFTHKEAASPIDSLIANVRSVFKRNHTIDLK